MSSAKINLSQSKSSEVEGFFFMPAISLTDKKDFIEALTKKYEADVSVAKATISVYMDKSVGIGEHPQHFEEMDKLVCAMASTKDNLMTLNDEYGEGEKPELLNESYGGTDPD